MGSSPFHITADYMLDYPMWKRVVFLIDVTLFGLLYFMVGIFFSAVYNDQVIGVLDRNQTRLSIFIQCMAEAVLVIITIYGIIHFVSKVPSLISNPPEEHLKFRMKGGDVLLAFSIISCQLLYFDKLRYLYNEVKDSEIETEDDIRENWNNCIDGISPAGEFVCA